MARGHVNRTDRPNTWLHRPMLQREESPCQLGAVHTWPLEPYHPCFAARFGGVSGGSETQGWRDSSHTAMVGAGKFGSAKLPMATLTYPGKPVLSQYMVEPHVGQK